MKVPHHAAREFLSVCVTFLLLFFMGQSHSDTASRKFTYDSKSSTTAAVDSSTPSISGRRRSSLSQLRHKLKRIELYSLHQIFDDLKTVYSDGFECIEAKKFLASFLLYIVQQHIDA